MHPAPGLRYFSGMGSRQIALLRWREVVDVHLEIMVHVPGFCNLVQYAVGLVREFPVERLRQRGIVVVGFPAHIPLVVVADRANPSARVHLHDLRPYGCEHVPVIWKIRFNPPGCLRGPLPDAAQSINRAAGADSFSVIDGNHLAAPPIDKETAALTVAEPGMESRAARNADPLHAGQVVEESRLPHAPFFWRVGGPCWR